ncbi:unnamed protein product [Cylicostephanus goldi]|uniref:DUF4440 domain-containing protein n=1 Tax=Cylicostephanus goldi TaxID=71465 RepID=A0A3P6SAN5_CYLGO|nr:unnamed protein product [Cylicostephanus goldi]
MFFNLLVDCFHCQLAAFYDPDAVIVHAGKDVVYGREALKKDFEEFLTRAGKLTPKSSNHYYRMCEEFINLTADYETETEKMGVLKGRFTQIWRKCNGEYLIIHLEDAPKML